MTYQLQGSIDLETWVDLDWVPVTETTREFEVETEGAHRFFRVLQ